MVLIWRPVQTNLSIFEDDLRSFSATSEAKMVGISEIYSKNYVSDEFALFKLNQMKQPNIGK